MPRLRWYKATRTPVCEATSRQGAFAALIIRQPAAHHTECAEREMRNACEDLYSLRSVADALGDDAEIKVAGAGKDPEHAVGKVERTEYRQERLGGAPGVQCGRGGPNAGCDVQCVLVDVQAKQAEDFAIRINERRHVIGCGGEKQRDGERGRCGAGVYHLALL